MQPINNPIISVIMPVYNIETYLVDAVQSVTDQAFPSFELILINDGSTDNSGIICEQLSLQDSRIKVIHQDNIGLGATRNKGLTVATGEFVTFIDSDDFVDKNYLDSLYLQLTNKNADMAVASIVQYYGLDDKRNSGVFQTNDTCSWDGSEFAEMGLYYETQLSQCGRLCRTAKAREFLANPGALYEDVFPSYQLAMSCQKVVGSTATYFYRMREASIQHQPFTDGQVDRLREAIRLEKLVTETNPSAVGAVEHHVVSSGFNVLRKLPSGKRYALIRKNIQKEIDLRRWRVIVNNRARVKVRVALGISLISYKLLNPLYRFGKSI